MFEKSYLAVLILYIAWTVFLMYACVNPSILWELP